MTCSFNFPRNNQGAFCCHSSVSFLGKQISSNSLWKPWVSPRKSTHVLYVAYFQNSSDDSSPSQKCPQQAGNNTSAPVGTLSLHFQVAEFADWAGSSDTRQGPEAGKQKTAQNTREWDLLVGLRSFQHRTEEIRKGLKTSLFHEFWCWGLNTRPCICESEYLATQLFPWQWIFCVLN